MQPGMDDPEPTLADMLTEEDRSSLGLMDSFTELFDEVKETDAIKKHPFAWLSAVLFLSAPLWLISGDLDDGSIINLVFFQYHPLLMAIMMLVLELSGRHIPAVLATLGLSSTWLVDKVVAESMSQEMLLTGLIMYVVPVLIGLYVLKKGRKNMGPGHGRKAWSTCMAVGLLMFTLYFIVPATGVVIESSAYEDCKGEALNYDAYDSADATCLGSQEQDYAWGAMGVVGSMILYVWPRGVEVVEEAIEEMAERRARNR
jgi:hypothetical protein